MEPETLETVVEGLKAGGLIVGASIACLATIFSGAAGIIKYSERKQLVNKMMPAYRNGHLTQKPNVFNICRMTNSEVAYLYHTKSISGSN